jgi:phosphate transport system substrate-binding protein
MGEYMMYRHFGPFPGNVFTSNYEQYLTYKEVAKTVEHDRSAVGILPLNHLEKELRVVPMPATDGKGMTTGSAEDIIADRYPYPRDLFLYIRREPNTPLDPIVAEYVKLVLSKEGQMALAQDDKGYLPLNKHDIDEELQRLDRAATWAPRSKQGPKLNFPFPSPEPIGNE